MLKQVLEESNRAKWYVLNHYHSHDYGLLRCFHDSFSYSCCILCHLNRSTEKKQNASLGQFICCFNIFWLFIRETSNHAVAHISLSPCKAMMALLLLTSPKLLQLVSINVSLPVCHSFCFSIAATNICICQTNAWFSLTGMRLNQTTH